MKHADLLALVKTLAEALEAAPARFRLNFQPYWDWDQQIRQPAIEMAKAALSEVVEKS